MNDAVTWLEVLLNDIHPAGQFLAVGLIAIVPFLESYVGAMVGTMAGLPVPLALGAAIVGNLLALLIAVELGSRLSARLATTRSDRRTERHQKIVDRVDRWGVPAASLIGPLVMAISVTAFAMAAMGLNRRQVVLWQTVSIVAWGALFAAFGAGIFAMLGRA